MKKQTYLSILTLFLILFFSGAVFAQSNVTGKVIAFDDNSPIPNVVIRVKGKKVNSFTNEAGLFTISASGSDILTFTYGGYKSQSVSVDNRSNINIVLVTANADLGPIVVTALDVKKNPKEVGHAIQKVSGAEIAEAQQDNFLNALQGRVAGITVTPTSGVAGASSSIVLRGYNSLSGNNQPLFIVDGIILSNQSFDEQNGYGLASDRPNRSNDYTNRIADLNPNDFESVTVLKGPEAAALYGSQASAGAILITLKKPKKAESRYTKLSYDNSYRLSYTTRLPNVQSTYSTGTNGIPGATINSFGPRNQPSTKTYDNVANFFRPGKSFQNNWTLDFGNKKWGAKYSGSVLDQRGSVYSNDFIKFSGRVSMNVKLLKDKLEISPSIFTTTSKNNKPLRGQGSYMQSLLIWDPKDDVRKYVSAGLTQFLDDGETITQFENPFFANLYNRNYDQNTRVTYSTAINYNPYKWLSVNGRFGWETSDQKGSTLYHPNSFRSENTNGGYLDIFVNYLKANNHNLTATAKKSFGKFNTRLMVGQAYQNYRREITSVSGNQIVNVNLIDSSQISGTRLRLQRNQQFGLPQLIDFRQSALFTELGLNYNEILFFTASARTEISSTLPKNSRRYSYPGASVSFVFSDLQPLKESKILSYGKLRASAANTARINSPYSNQSRLQLITSSGGGSAQGFTGNNPDLTPEKQKTYEAGVELKLFKNKIGLDITYYNTEVSDIILEDFRSSYPAVGSILGTINGGVLKNQGIEVILDLNPVKNKVINWNMKFNFSKTWNKVLSLPGAVPEFYISDSWLAGNVRNGIVSGGTTTSITGFKYRTNSAGELLINPATGFPIQNTDNWVVIGDRNPDFVLSLLNNLKVKRFSLSFLWDLKVGGDIYNGTDWYLTNNGKSLRTTNREQTRIVNGVLRDGYENSATPTRNNIAITPYLNQAYWGSLNGEEFIEKDVNWLRLRHVTLDYEFNKKAFGKLKFFKDLKVFATITDPVLITNYSGADPAVNGNSPSSKGVGGFGFDFLNIGTPVGVNFGLRASF